MGIRVTMFALALSVVAAGEARAAALPWCEPLTIRTYDNYGVSSRDLADGRNVASALLAEAGVDIAWRECRPLSSTVGDTCPEPVGPHDLVVRLVRSTDASVADSLGYSLVDQREHAGTVATVFVDRVNRLALMAMTVVGRLLGRVMAHEVGHLLSGSSRHSGSGLMRARWAPADIHSEDSIDWRFAPGDALAVNRGAARRDAVARMAAVHAPTADHAR